MVRTTVSGLLLLAALNEATAVAQQTPQSGSGGMAGMPGMGLGLGSGGGFDVSGGSASGPPPPGPPPPGPAQAGSPGAGLGLSPGGSFGVSQGGAPGASAGGAQGGPPSGSFDISGAGLGAGFPQGTGPQGAAPQGSAGGLPSGLSGGAGGFGGQGGQGMSLGGAPGGSFGVAPGAGAGGLGAGGLGASGPGAGSFGAGGLGAGGLGAGSLGAGSLGTGGPGLMAGGQAGAGAGGAAPSLPKDISPIYLDVTEKLVSTKNVAFANWPALQAGLVNANITAEATTTGWDWTGQYPSTNTSGFKTHLRVAYDVPVVTQTGNSTSAISSLTFSVPGSMMNSDGTVKAMNPSWYVCQHIFVSTKVNSTLGDDCGSLPAQCLTDLKAAVTSKWMKNADLPCSGLPGDAIPATCTDAFGNAHAEVLAMTSQLASDKANNGHWAVDQQDQAGFHVGTGPHPANDTASVSAAQSRTFMVATVYGPSQQVDAANRKTPEAVLSCVAAKPPSKAATPVGPKAANVTGTATGTSHASASATESKKAGAQSGFRSSEIRGTLALALVGAFSYMFLL